MTFILNSNLVHVPTKRLPSIVVHLRKGHASIRQELPR